MKLRLLALISALGLASGCGSDGLGPGELGLLAKAQFRWDNRNFRDYRFEMRQICFCSPLVTQPVRVVVHDDSIVQVVEVTTDSTLPPDQYALWPTIDELFTMIRQFHHDENVKDVRVSYDQALGYPRKVEIIPEKNVADGGGTFEVSEVMSVP